MIPPGALQLGLLVAIAICCVALWNQIFALRSTGHQIVRYEPRRIVPWGPFDVVALALGTILIVNLCTLPLRYLEKHAHEEESVTGQAADEHHDENGAKSVEPAAETTASGEAGNEGAGKDNTEPPHAAATESGEKPATSATFGLLAAASIGTMLSLAAGMAWLTFRGATRDDLGLSAGALGRDFLRGLAGFLVASLPVYLIQIVAVQFIPAAHPVSDIFQSRPSVLTLVATAVTAVVVAPLTEEFFFRVVLQGWLERLFAERDVENLPAPESMPTARSNDEAQTASEDVPCADAPVVGAAVDHLVQASAESSTPIFPERTSIGQSPAASRPSMVPVYLSSFIFAIVHLDYGPSALPLFFFALVLGYLYRQTHRLWPSVVAHASLNAVSTFMLLTTAV